MAATVIVIGGVIIGQAGGPATGLSGDSAGSDPALTTAEDQKTGAADSDGLPLEVAPQSASPNPGVGGADDSAAIAPEPPAVGGESALDYNVGGGSGGGIARGAEERLTDATARISLGAEADEVQEVANGVVSVTDRYDGIVVNSQVTSDRGGARASFELEIPFAELDAALTDLSELGDVISRTETAEDVTPKAVRAQKDLVETLDQIRKAQERLIAADSREEKLILRSQIDSLKAQADGFEAQLGGVQREARFATVSVDVTSNGPETDDGGWGIDDAIDDAGDVLTAIGGIALVSLAVLVPLGLLAAIAFWLTTRAQRTRRERALDGE